MSLEENFLNYFSYSGEQFAIFNDELFTIEKRTNDSGNSLNICNYKYSLESADKIIEEENDFYDRNSDLIKATMSNYIKIKYIEELKAERDNLVNLNNLYNSMQDINLEKFIKIDVYNEFHYKEDNQETNQINVNTEINADNSCPDINELKSDKSILSQLIKNDGLLGIGESTFNLIKSNNKNENKGYITYNNQIYELGTQIDLKKLAKNYSNLLKNNIIKLANQHGSRFLNQIDRINSEKNQLEQLINQRSATSDDLGEIQIRPINNNRYEISISIDPYIIQKDNIYYFFNRTKAGAELSASGSKVQLCSKPRILNMPYVHPFVWESGDICYGSYDWSAKGIHTNKKYDISNPEERQYLATMTARALKKARQVIIKGYIGNKIHPVKQIIYCNAEIARSKNDAINYARSNNINIGRIFKNA